MADDANKYEEEARLLTKYVEDNKWGENGGATALLRTRESDVRRFTREQPLTALVYAAGAAFIFGALWGIGKR